MIRSGTLGLRIERHRSCDSRATARSSSATFSRPDSGNRACTRSLRLVAVWMTLSARIDRYMTGAVDSNPSLAPGRPNLEETQLRSSGAALDRLRRRVGHEKNALHVSSGQGGRERFEVEVDPRSVLRVRRRVETLDERRLPGTYDEEIEYAAMDVGSASERERYAPADFPRCEQFRGYRDVGPPLTIVSASRRLVGIGRERLEPEESLVSGGARWNCLPSAGLRMRRGCPRHSNARVSFGTSNIS